MDSDIPQRQEDLTGQASQELEPSDVAPEDLADTDDFPIDLAQMLRQATEQTRMAMCISDPHQPDCPMVYVNQAFVEATGYSRDELIGRNCRLLQGQDTDPADVQRIRDALESEEVRVIEILNYRKDGTPFWNAVHVGPIYDEAGNLSHYYGSQWDITDLRAERDLAAMQRRVAEETQHRTTNLFTVVNAIVRLSARGATDAQALADTVSSRIQAMADAQRIAVNPKDSGGLAGDLQAIVSTILKPYRSDAEGRISIEGPAVNLPPQAVTALGLTLHELATNALKHGSLSVDTGKVAVDWSLTRDRLTLIWAEDGGPPVDPVRVRESTGTGSRIVGGVLGGIGGKIDFDWREMGLKCTIVMPLV